MVVTVSWQKVDIGIESLTLSLREQGWNVDYLELTQEQDNYATLMAQVHNLAPSIIVFASYFAEDIVQFYQTFIRNPTNAIIYSIYAPSAFLPHEKLCEGVLWSTNSGLSENYLGRQFSQHYERFSANRPLIPKPVLLMTKRIFWQMRGNRVFHHGILKPSPMRSAYSHIMG